MDKKQKKLWGIFAAVIVLSFGVLLYYGKEIYQQAPPIPTQVVNENGEVVYSETDIKNGQNVWQSTGGQELGSVWGHGSYVAPDWTADRLHREALIMLDLIANETYQKKYDELSHSEKNVVELELQQDIRKNTYDPATGIITISSNREAAAKELEIYYSKLFTDDPEFDQLRKDYAMRTNTLEDPVRLKELNAFFFWATWATVTERPNQEISYTHNWPNEKLVGNNPTTSLYLWSGVSVIALILFIGILVAFHAVSRKDEELPLPKEDPLIGGKVTHSMSLLRKYFWIVSALMLAQVGLGIITAHYGVEGQGLYGIPLEKLLPYSVTRTWHTQLAIFWIATAWLGTGLYVAPSLTGKDPKFQVFGVNFLFYALLVIVVGSMIGQWLGIMQKLGYVENFWFGHQGYEYVDLGRFWQLFLFVGLLVWLILMIRPLIPVIKSKNENKNLIYLFLISCASIALFYGAGLMWGQHTNLAIAEYWRWWVVHLWVEGFFEVFATVVAAFLFVRLGLLRSKTAIVSVLLSNIIFLSGGIIGTFHHLYFSGTPTAVMAFGSVFSALEVVPLTLIGFEAYENYRISKEKGWLNDYKWPIMYLVSVSFWNFLGAGVFGFLINPPISLYFVQGLNTTPLHGHTALFGVYGFLGIALMLFVLRSIYRDVEWNEKLMKVGFWGMNIGLLLMALLSLLPIGIWQAVESMQHGMWYARSAELMQQPAMITLKWLRTIGDIILAVGMVALVYFVFHLSLKHKTIWQKEHPNGE